MTPVPLGATEPRPIIWRVAVGAIAVLVGAVFLTTAPPGASPANQAHRSVAPPAAPLQDTARRQAEDAGIDVDGIADRVSHRVEVDPSQQDALTVSDANYRATFDVSGFTVAASAESPLRWSLRGLSRARERAELRTGGWTAEGNAAERRVAPGATERVTARSGELEWDLVLASAPRGAGDLVVEADLIGLAGRPQRDGESWHLPLGGGGSAQLGALVVRDATGAEVHRAAPDIDGGGLSLQVPAQVLDTARYPLTLDPTVTPEHSVSRVGTDASEYKPVVAFDGTNFLVVWHDQSPTSYANIIGTRVSPQGVVLDVDNIVISPANASQVDPAVSFDGVNYLVVWKDDRSGAGYDIYGARVTTAGTVIDDISGFVISNRAGNQEEPAVAFNGTEFLVSWADASTTDILGTRVTSGALVREPNGIPISTAASVQEHVRIAPSGSNWLVVWEDGRSGDSDIYGTRVTSAGSVLDPNGIAISTAVDYQNEPDLASDGTNALVVWEDHRNFEGHIRGSRVTPAGVVLDPNGLRLTNDDHLDLYPSVSFGDGEYLVTWSDYFDASSPGIHGERVSTAGSVIGDDIPISIDRPVPVDSSTASGGGVYFVAFDDPRFGSADISGARVDPGSATEVLDRAGLLLTPKAVVQGKASVAFDGTNYLVVWEDRRNGSRDIYATRVTPAGMVLDSQGIAVSDQSVSEATPDVVWNGTDFMVVWEDYRLAPGPAGSDIYGARVTSDGDVLDPTGILVSNGMFNQSEPSIAFDGTDTFVVWTDLRSAPDTDIYGARINSAGTVLNPNGIAISTNPTNQSKPALAFDGARHLVVWQDDRSGAGLDIYGSRVTRLGVVLNPVGLAISNAVDDQTSPAVAFDGTNNLVVWQDRRSGTNFDIYGTGVTQSGVVTSPSGTAVSTGPGDQRLPAVAFNGSYLVAWLDRTAPGANNRVFATRFSTSGAVQDNPALGLANTGGDQGRPALTAGPNGTWGVANDHPSVGGDGIFLRKVAPK